MSNRQLEERQERDFEKAVAEALGISINDLDKVEWTEDRDESGEGVHYGHIITFEEGSDQDVLNKIVGLEDNRWIKIHPIDMDRYDDE